MKSLLSLASVFLAVCVLSAQAAPAEVDPAKAADIHHLLELTKARQLTMQMFDPLLKLLPQLLEKSVGDDQRRKEIVRTFWQKTRERLESDELIELLIPIWDKYLTHEETKGLISFYESPLGQKVLEVTPKIMEEGQSLGGQWGQKVVQEILREMEDDYPELRQIQK